MLLRLTQLIRECKLHQIQSVYEAISPDSTAPKFEAEIILLEANMWVGTRGEYWRGSCDDRWRNGKSKPEPFSTECQGRRPEADDIIYTFVCASLCVLLCFQHQTIYRGATRTRELLLLGSNDIFRLNCPVICTLDNPT